MINEKEKKITENIERKRRLPPTNSLLQDSLSKSLLNGRTRACEKLLALKLAIFAALKELARRAPALTIRKGGLNKIDQITPPSEIQKSPPPIFHFNLLFFLSTRVFFFFPQVRFHKRYQKDKHIRWYTSYNSLIIL